MNTGSESPTLAFDVAAFIEAAERQGRGVRGKVWSVPGPTPWRYRVVPGYERLRKDHRDYFVEQPGWTEQVRVRGELEAKAVAAILNWCHEQTGI